ncbi:MAG: lysylphosphatidylglycerol synthase transmembrane domain-containing protein [Candidatus Omnitrophica bacterium]|nr:lysylphosphatidylglycerol synthase transmembrane domain-containing protein [Candidatus Omnitrophota bacterium]MDD5592025.1 lysylphosphatidylglycerol synthase transmembrane domain-containing protein [Candidatus Omnitrophota bacterium]
MKILKQILPVFLRVGISIVLLIFLFRHVDAKALWKVVSNADIGLVLLAAFIYFSLYILALFRWEMLLKGAKVYLPLKRVIISFAGGNFFNIFLPSSIGGDLIRSIDLATHTKRPREVVTTVLLDRLSGYIGLVTVTLLALVFGWGLVEEKSVFWSVAVITGVLVVALLILFNSFLYSKINQILHSPTAGRMREAIKNLHQEIHIFRHRKNIIVNNLILSILIQSITPLTFYIIALSLGVKINIAYFFVYIPIIGAITLLPISIGGLGLRDATTIYFFSKAGMSKDLAFAMSLINFSFILVYALIGGLIYVLNIHHRRMQYHKPQQVHPCP